MKRGWSIAIRNLRRNRRRNFTTAAAIAIGYAGLVILGGYATRVERLLRTNTVYLQQNGHVAVFLEGGFRKASAEPEKFQLGPDAQARVLAWAKNDPRVEFASRSLVGVGLAGNGCATQPARLLGVEVAKQKSIMQHPEVRAWSPELATPLAGRWIDDATDVPHAVSLSAGLATLLEKPRVFDQAKGLPPAPIVLHCDGPEQADELGRDADIQLVGMTYDDTLSALDTEMVSTFHAAEQGAEDGSFMVALETLQELFATDRVTSIALYLHHAGDAHAVANDIRADLARAGLAVEALTYDDEDANPYYAGTVAFLGAMVGFITLLVSLVLVLTVFGAMTLTILERTREIGTLRALGFHRGTVISLVVREAFLLSLLGLAAGLALGLAGGALINISGLRIAPPGIAGSIPLLIYPSPSACAKEAALLVPGVCIAAWAVARGRVKRNLVELLTSQTG